MGREREAKQKSHAALTSREPADNLALMIKYNCSAALVRTCVASGREASPCLLYLMLFLLPAIANWLFFTEGQEVQLSLVENSAQELSSSKT